MNVAIGLVGKTGLKHRAALGTHSARDGGPLEPYVKDLFAFPRGMGLAAIEPTHRLALAVSATLARGSNLSPGDATNLTALAGLARDAATGAALVHVRHLALLSVRVRLENFLNSWFDSVLAVLSIIESFGTHLSE